MAHSAVDRGSALLSGGQVHGFHGAVSPKQGQLLRQCLPALPIRAQKCQVVRSLLK